jgi:hypothetical protein
MKQLESWLRFKSFAESVVDAVLAYTFALQVGSWTVGISLNLVLTTRLLLIDVAH